MIFVLRLWVPDKPGSLGAVATAIGSQQGDLVGIEILERGAGQAIDELVVEVEQEGMIQNIVLALAEIEGVAVEDVRAVTRWTHDLRLDGLESAEALLSQSTEKDLFSALVADCAADFEADWGVVVDDQGVRKASVGGPPEPAWLAAFIAGVTVAETSSATPEDIAYAQIGKGVALVIGRDGRPFRAGERGEMSALARIAAHRLAGIQ